MSICEKHSKKIWHDNSECPICEDIRAFNKKYMEQYESMKEQREHYKILEGVYLNERKALELACNFANLGQGKYWIGIACTPDYFRNKAKE